MGQYIFHIFNSYKRTTPTLQSYYLKSCKLTRRGVERVDLWSYNQCSLRSSVLYKRAASASQILLQMPEQSRLTRMFSIHPLSLANADFTLASAPQSHTNNSRHICTHTYILCTCAVRQIIPAHIYRVHMFIPTSMQKTHYK